MLNKMKKHDRKYFFGKKGQRLLVREWGPLTQPVILLIHGFPGCSDHGKLMSGSPLWNSFRLIALDRPGYGSSEPQKKITPLKFAAQVEYLLNHLKIDKFSILSVSGGAPYSMAIAYHLKKRVQRVTSIGGVAPLSPFNFLYMNSQQKKAWIIQNLVPGPVLNKLAQKLWKKNTLYLDKLLFTRMDSFSAADQKILKDPKLGPELVKSMKIALKNGPEGVLTDMKVYAKQWGFPLKKINCPVTLWHGGQDDVVHVKFARDMKRKLPRAKINFIENEGHYSLLANYRDAILKDLL
jgi:pimeloyl-ACP methyl ester carboxylesterase